MAESYGRAYVPLIMVQQCAELEEITEYKMLLREAGLSDVPSTHTPMGSRPGSTSLDAPVSSPGRSRRPSPGLGMDGIPAGAMSPKGRASSVSVLRRAEKDCAGKHLVV